MYQLVALFALLGISFAAVAEVKLLECPFVDKEDTSGVLYIWIDAQSEKAEVLEEPTYGGVKRIFDKEVLPSTIRLTLTFRSGNFLPTRFIDVNRKDLTATVWWQTKDISPYGGYTAICELKEYDSKNQL